MPPRLISDTNNPRPSQPTLQTIQPIQAAQQFTVARPQQDFSGGSTAAVALPGATTMPSGESGVTDMGRPIGSTINQATGGAFVGPVGLDPAAMADFARATQGITAAYNAEQHSPQFAAAQARNSLDQDAEKQYWNDIGKGQDWANQNFAEGSMGRLSDPRLAEMNALLAQQKDAAGKDAYATGAFGTAIDPRARDAQQYLSKLKTGMQGMTPQEMQAAREQGEAEINRQLATNMQRLGNVAAAHGVRGGAGAGLQQRALSEAQMQSGDLARKMILDNQAQRNLGTQMYGQALNQQQATELGIQGQNMTARQAELVGNVGQRNVASDRYGQTLTGQQARELGIAQENLGAQRQEQFGRTSTPFQIASGLDAARSGSRADELSRQQLDTAKEYVKQFGATGGFGNDKNAVSADDKATAQKFYSDYSDSLSAAHPENPGYATDFDNYHKNSAATQYLLSLGKSNDADLTPEQRKIYGEKLADDLNNKELQKTGSKLQKDGNPKGCYVATAAMNLGKIPGSQLQELITKCPTNKRNIRAYMTWGPIFAKWMQKYPMFARFVMFFFQDTILVMRGQPSTLRGKIGHKMYSVITRITKYYLKKRRKHGR